MMTTDISASENTFFGHPKALFILFFTEMWERFSFYGMKALLIFYLTKYHLFSDINGNLLIGSYAALVYAVPVIGGFIADKYLGFRKAIVFGGIMLVLGHMGMAYEGNAATQSVTGEITRDNVALQVFYFSLALIILGVGFLKANISSLVGELYAVGDKRRDSGFTLFYMGINLGSFLATIICVWLGEAYGWSYGFGAAGVGMLLGLITFISGKKLLMGKGESNAPDFLEKRTFGLKNEWLIYLASVLSTVVFWQMVQRHEAVSNSLIIAGAILFFMFKYSMGPFKNDVVNMSDLQEKYCSPDGDQDICDCILRPLKDDMEARFSATEIDSFRHQKIKAAYVLQKSLRATKETALACLTVKGQANKYTVFLQDFVPIENKYLNSVGDKARDLGDRLKAEISNFKNYKEDIDKKY